MRLSQAELERLAPSVGRFDYPRSEQKVGIVHFGIGAFHRAHQAWYTDLAMDGGDRDWAIVGVSLRSSEVAAQLNPQDGLYTHVEIDGSGARRRVIGSVAGVLVAASDPEAVIARVAAPTTHIVTFTITEKGYCRAPDGSLDLAMAGEGSCYRFLVEALRRRRDAGLGGVTLISCDNLSGNGGQLARLTGEYCARHDPTLGAWVRDECAFPNTMVDRIVPASTASELDTNARAIGLEDAGAVITEPFSQWVIEDRFAGPRPGWAQAGAALVEDVAPHETAKLRMLNGAHSALAYLGLRRGHVHVDEAVADPAIRPVVEQLMRREAATSFVAAPGQDLTAYADSLMARFTNPALRHRLAQIAMDGSQKIPQRWLQTLAVHQGRGERCPALLEALAAWLRHIRGEAGPINDPLADQLRELGRAGDGLTFAGAVFGPRGLMGTTWAADESDLQAIATWLQD